MFADSGSQCQPSSREPAPSLKRQEGRQTAEHHWRESSPKGIQEYLVLLSISETCKYRGLSFLDFLRSGEMEVDAFGRRVRG